MILTPYGTAATFDVDVYDEATGKLTTAVTFVAGDVKLSIDGGALANVSALPTVVNGRYRWAATALELTGKKMRLVATKTGILDAPLYLATIGHASALIPGIGLAAPLAATALDNGVALTTGARNGIVADVLAGVVTVEPWEDLAATAAGATTKAVTVYAPDGTTVIGTRLMKFTSDGQLVGMGKLTPPA